MVHGLVGALVASHIVVPTDISGKISIGTKIWEIIFCIAQFERLLCHSTPTTPMRILILLLPRLRCATGSSLGGAQARCPSIVVALWLPTHICGVCIGSVMIVLTTLHCTKAGSCHHKDVEQACSSLALDFAIGNVSLARLTRQAWWPWQSRRH